MSEDKLDVISQKLDFVSGLLAGTYERPGLVHRVAALESCARSSWWFERGTKIVDLLVAAIIVGGLVVLVRAGFKETLRDMMREAPEKTSAAMAFIGAMPDKTTRHVPRPPECGDCKDATTLTAQAE